jgi:ribosomal protein L16 Arg81 hydroxylase
MNFQFLINPIKLETFFSEYYQKKHLHIKRTDKNYFRGILSMENIDNYLSRNDVYYPALRIVKNGKELDNSLYLKNDSFGQYGLVDMDKLFEQYCTNSTVVFQAFQRSLDTLRELCLNMHEQTSINFSANIYMTPCASRGFNYHYDTHDVIILQTFGKKKFYLYDTPVHLPTKQQGHNQSEEFKKKDYKTEKPIFEEVLEAGDVLYIPRGLVHNAESLENTSLHCTLGFFPQKWHDLFANLNSKITFIDEFRQTIPFIYEEADINKIKILEVKLK